MWLDSFSWDLHRILRCRKCYLWFYLLPIVGFPGGSGGKEPASSMGDLSLSSGLRRSPGGGHGKPLQYSCLENPHGQTAWRLQSMGSHGIRYIWVTKHSTAQVSPRRIQSPRPSNPRQALPRGLDSRPHAHPLAHLMHTSGMAFPRWFRLQGTAL